MALLVSAKTAGLPRNTRKSREERRGDIFNLRKPLAGGAVTGGAKGFGACGRAGDVFGRRGSGLTGAATAAGPRAALLVPLLEAEGYGVHWIARTCPPIVSFSLGNR